MYVRQPPITGAMTRRRWLPALLSLLVLACLPPAAQAAAYEPPHGKVWNGLTAGFDASEFESRTGKHAAIWQHFIAWGGSYQYTLENSRRANSRLMLHLGTAQGQNLPERLSPGQIARGDGDGFLVGLTRDIAGVGAPVYLRLMGEMNNCNNAYAAHSCSGGRRDRDHSTGAFKRAWKRTYLIMHGGDVATIDTRLRALGLPPVQAGARTLPEPQVAFMWAPMTGGAPNIRALRPQAYWPGSNWVDWVGTSFYSRFPNFTGLDRFYADFAVGKRKPFAIAEWAIWGADAPAFATRLFGWIAAHRRAEMVQYNQGAHTGGIFRLSHYPASARVIRQRLRHPRYLGFAPEQRQARGASISRCPTTRSRQPTCSTHWTPSTRSSLRART